MDQILFLRALLLSVGVGVLAKTQRLQVEQAVLVVV
jgi:hypothetical protein